MKLRTVNVTRYITPLREGGSLPALAEADDDFKYVLKFKGAGHGTKALIAELLGGEIARALGLRLPEIVFANLDEAFGRTEADEEIQDLLQFSQGLNLALHFLSGAITFDPVVTDVDAELASQIVWLDAFITFYFHHSWNNWEHHAKSPFALIKDHVLLPKATLLETVDTAYKALLTEEKIREIVALIPDEWLLWDDNRDSPEDLREVYVQFLLLRKSHSEIFIKEAQNARETLI